MSVPLEANDHPGPRRILLLKEGRDLYGAEQATLRLLRCLDATRYEVEVWVVEYGAKPSAFLTAAQSLECAITVKPVVYSGPLGLMGALRARLREGDVDVLWTIGYKPDILGLLASRFLPVFRLAILHGWVSTSLNLKVYNMLDRLALRRFHGILTVSSPLLALARKLVDKKRAGCIFNGVDLRELGRLASEPLTESLPANLGHEAPVLAFVGRLSPEKNVAVLLEAFAKVATPNGPAPVLVVAGDGPERGRLEKLATKLKLGSRVFFTGHLDNPYPLMQRARALVLPSKYEALPLVLIEAMGLGTAVVASNVGGIPDVVEHDSTGILVQAGNVHSLSNALEALSVDANLALKLGSTGQTRVHAAFSDWQVASRFQQILDMWMVAHERRA